MLNINDVYILIPVKRLENSKSRLSNVLSNEERRRLVLLMLQDVVDKVKHYPNLFIVTEDELVNEFCEEQGLKILNPRHDELNQDLRDANTWCINQGAKATLIILADLPALSSVDVEKIIRLSGKCPAAVIAPSRDGGTNVLLLSPSDLIAPSFGKESFEKHLSNINEVGAEVQIYNSFGASLDIDEIEDIQRLLELKNDIAPISRALFFLESIIYK
jgi:2-phospho-L-lactate guanylyltransferase